MNHLCRPRWRAKSSALAQIARPITSAEHADAFAQALAIITASASGGEDDKLTKALLDDVPAPECPKVASMLALLAGHLANGLDAHDPEREPVLARVGLVYAALNAGIPFDDIPIR